MTTKQKIGMGILIAIVLIGFSLVSMQERKIMLMQESIEGNTKATACEALNRGDSDGIIDCIQDN